MVFSASDAPLIGRLLEIVRGLDDERVAFPVAARVAHVGLHPRRQVRPAVERDHARLVHHLVADGDEAGALRDVVPVAVDSRHHRPRNAARDAADVEREVLRAVERADVVAVAAAPRRPHGRRPLSRLVVVGASSRPAGRGPSRRGCSSRCSSRTNAMVPPRYRCRSCRRSSPRLRGRARSAAERAWTAPPASRPGGSGRRIRAVAPSGCRSRCCCCRCPADPDRPRASVAPCPLPSRGFCSSRLRVRRRRQNQQRGTEEHPSCRMRSGARH